MISKIRKFLGIQTLEEKYGEYESLQESLSLEKSNLDNLVSSHIEYSEEYKSNRNILFDEIKKGNESSNNLLNRINDQWKDHFQSYLKKVAIIKGNLDSLNQKIDKLVSSDESLKKAIEQVKLHDSYNVVRAAYKIGQVKRDVLEKAYLYATKEKKTKYADCIVRNEEGKILLLKRNEASDFCPGVYCLPGGHVDVGENHEEAAKRECEEEIGLVVEEAKYVGMYEDDKSIIKYYECTIEDSEDPLKDKYEVFLHGNEHSNYIWATREEYLQLDLIMNLKDVLNEIYGDELVKKEIIKKAVESLILAHSKGLIGDSVLEKATKNYKLLLERLEARRTDKQYTKEEVDYVDNFKDGEHVEENSCDHCSYYRPKEEDNCLKVIGKISHNGHCKLWESQDIEKAIKTARDLAKLVKKKKLVTRDGKTFLMTVYENPRTGERSILDEKEVKHTPTIDDLQIGERFYIKTSRLEGEFLLENIHLKDGSEPILYGIIGDEIKVISSSSIKVFKKIEGGGEKEVDKTFISKDIDVTLSDLTPIRVLGGSSGVQLMSDKNGNKYAVKSPHKGDINQLKQEKIINDLYKSLGFEAPESIVDEKGGVLISRFIENAKELNAVPITSELKKEIQKGFVLDCLLANLDVLGASKDNILIKEGKVIRVDNGGSLKMRAKGGSPKPFEREVGEIKTMREYDPGRQIYGDITDEEISIQVTDLIKNSHKLQLINILSPELFGTTLKRLAYLNDIYNLKATSEPKKEKVEDKTEKLRSDMPSMVTQKYFDEKWSKVNINGNKGINEHIKKHILEIEKNNKRDYEKIALSVGISVEEVKANMQKWVEDIVGRSKGYIVAHSGFGESSSKVIASVISEGRFKTQFESGTSMGSLAPDYRSSTELKYFGFNEGVDDKSIRPIYGFFTDQPNGAINSGGKVPPPRTVSQYGDICFEVREEKFKKDATVTFQDSLGSASDISASPFIAPHFTSVQATQYHYNGLKRMYENKVTSGSGGGGYVELQYHGQLKLEDIKQIHISVDEYGSRSKLSSVINEVNTATAVAGKSTPINLF